MLGAVFPATTLKLSILSPCKKHKQITFQICKRQAERKLAFFQKVYPECKAKLYLFKQQYKTYRLVLPFFQGQELDAALRDASVAEQKNIYKLVLTELQRIHGHGIALTDLSSANILVSLENRKVYFVDGGNHVSVDSGYPGYLPALTAEQKTRYKKGSPHMPPEYWDPNKSANISSMDIFTFVYLHGFF